VPAERIRCRAVTPDETKARPTGLSKRKLRFNFFTPRRPVQWLAPLQLGRTGIRVGLADAIGAYLDKREQQNTFSDDAIREDEGRTELWLDYVADTGDGFNATYAIAYSLGKESIKVGKLELPRGQVLVMGGDEVYPTPSPEDYDDRLRGPYHAALPEVRPGQANPTIYAIPGNHDWYDGLTAFFRVFAGMKTTIGAWTTKQKRSYFAIKLPEKWWLFGIDAQPNAHIDDPQLEYFHKIINESLEDGDRIILCTPDPAWVKGKRDPNVYRVTDYFIRKVIDTAGQEAWLTEAYRGHRVPAAKSITVPVMLSGDWHHYSRYELEGTDEDRRHLITCGGGGAYLLGTQYLPRTVTTPPVDMRPPKRDIELNYARRKRYPSRGRSFWLGLGAPIRLPWRNPTFVVLLGILQLLMLYAWDHSGGQVTLGVLAITAVVLGLTTFLASGLGANRRNPVAIGILSILHASAQWFGVHAALAPLRSMWVPTATKATTALDVSDFDNVWAHSRFYLEWTGYYAAYGIVAGVVSAAVVGLYLIFASFFAFNINELFSSQRIEGHKSFLRLHIAPGGQLTVYAVGLRRVRRLLPTFRWLHWRANPKGQPFQPWFLPRHSLRYKLIDTITIPARVQPYR
jgi:hypothetical protein